MEKRGRSPSKLKGFRATIQKVRVRQKRRERKTYNGFDPEFYGFYPN